MTVKTKRIPAPSWRRVKSKVHDLIGRALPGIAIGLLILQLLVALHSDSPYRFCLAEVGGNTCVAIPRSLSVETSQASPDMLLRFFSGLPERVHQQWRVWIKDMSLSETIEMTVPAFHDWVDSVWTPLGRK